MHPWLQLHPSGTLLFIRLQPRAARNEAGPAMGDCLKIRVTAPPVENAANEALLKFLAGALKLPRSAVRLIRGSKARRKSVLLIGRNPSEVAAALGGR